MNQIIFKPELYKYDSCKDFVTEFSLGKGDLIITSETCYNAFFKPLDLDVDVIFPKNYGSGEPTDKMVNAMYIDIKKMGEHKRIIGIGGGSVLDVAKLFSLKEMMPLTDLYDRKIPVKKEKTLILIPTTCGTGSEVTNISVISFVERGSKIGLADAELFADTAVLIPELLEHLPYHFFATSSIDALIHAIESSLSPKATPYTKLFGYKAIEMILNTYKKMASDGLESYILYLEDVLIASNYAGLAFGTAGCGTIHAMSFPLSGTFHVAHGEANYVFLTCVLKYYANINCGGSLAELNSFMSSLLDCEPGTVNEALEELLSKILPKNSLGFYGTTEEHLVQWAESVYKNQQRLMKNSFVPLSQEQILEIYQAAK